VRRATVCNCPHPAGPVGPRQLVFALLVVAGATASAAVLVALSFPLFYVVAWWWSFAMAAVAFFQFVWLLGCSRSRVWSHFVVELSWVCCPHRTHWPSALESPWSGHDAWASQTLLLARIHVGTVVCLAAWAAVLATGAALVRLREADVPRFWDAGAGLSDHERRALYVCGVVRAADIATVVLRYAAVGEGGGCSPPLLSSDVRRVCSQLQCRVCESLVGRRIEGRDAFLGASRAAEWAEWARFGSLCD